MATPWLTGVGAVSRWMVEAHVATQERKIAMVWLEKEYRIKTSNGSHSHELRINELLTLRFK
jgi:hypothetical protein